MMARLYRVVRLVIDLLVLRSRSDRSKDPFQTTYTWASLDGQRTTMALRNAGQPAGFSKLLAPFIASAMRRANRKDLAARRHLVESR